MVQVRNIFISYNFCDEITVSGALNFQNFISGFQKIQNLHKKLSTSWRKTPARIMTVKVRRQKTIFEIPFQNFSLESLLETSPRSSISTLSGFRYGVRDALVFI